MVLSEFELIQRFFSHQSFYSKFTKKGVGDDAAIFAIPSGYEIVSSVDVLNERVHFPENTSAYDLGHKALAVSVSDIAAMGAEPFSALLTLSLPEAEPGWLEQFANGFFSLAKTCRIELIGGDVTKGPLSIATVVNGFLPQGQALLRSGAKVNDLIYVTGTLGDAGLALKLLTEEQESIPDELLNRLNRPTPRVGVGRLLLEIANSAMDISDGLVIDLEKLCEASGVGAEIVADRAPLSEAMQNLLSYEDALKIALTAGDDYELLFTISPENKSKLDQLGFDLPITFLGEIKSELGVVVKDKNDNKITLKSHGYDHFNSGGMGSD